MSHMYPEGTPVSYEDQSHIGEEEDLDEVEKCWRETNHEPNGWTLDDEHHAFLISNCEHCGIALTATDVKLSKIGEIQVIGYEET